MYWDYLWSRALELMEMRWHSLFLTGKAGTGKSTLLKQFLNTTKKNVINLASTGIAAVNTGWSTIHSFFRLHPNVKLDEVKPIRGNNLEVLKEADIIIMDEVSMVRADLLDCVSRCINLSLTGKDDLPFGGKQMIFIWDLFQLAPIVSYEERNAFKDLYKSEYFFSAKNYEKLNPKVIELQKVYRQEEEDFIDILNKIRIWIFEDKDLDYINKNIIEDMDSLESGTIVLTTTNADADTINQKNLSKLDSELHFSEAEIEWEVPKSFYPNAINLNYKVWAQIMMLRNTAERKNGSIGRILEIYEDIVIVEIDDEEYEVELYEWKIFKHFFNKKTKKIITETVGTFTQFPFKLAWGITIHKSQWLTFDNLCVDFGKRVFAKWQAYVALSRAVTTNWLLLKRAVVEKDVMIDKRVLWFMGKALIQQKVDMLNYAIEQEREVEFVYIKHEWEISKRKIIPQLVDKAQYKWYDFMALQAFDQEEEKAKLFSINKMYDIKLLSEYYT